MEGTCKNNIGWVTCRDLLVSLWPCEAFPGWIKIPELNRHWKGGGVIIEMSDVEWIIFPTCACCFTSPKSYFLFFFIPVDLSIPKNSTSCQMFGMHTLLSCSRSKDNRLQFSFCRLLCTPHATMAYQSDKAGRTGWSWWWWFTILEWGTTVLVTYKNERIQYIQ